MRQFIIGFGNALDQSFARRLGFVEHLSGDVALFHREAEIVYPVDRLHLEEIDDGRELGLAPDRQLQGHGIRAETLLDHVDRPMEIGADTIEFVDEANAGHLIAIGLPPHRFRLRLDALHAIKHHDPAVQHAQRALHFGGEVDVSGCVDDVDLIIAPVGR